MTEQTPIVQKLRDLATEAHANSANANYDAEKWRQHGRMEAFREAARLVDVNGTRTLGDIARVLEQMKADGMTRESITYALDKVFRSQPLLRPAGPPLLCVVCLRSAHWTLEGTSYCREHGVEVYVDGYIVWVMCLAYALLGGADRG